MDIAVLVNGLGATTKLTFVCRTVVVVCMAVDADTLCGVAGTLVHAATRLARRIANIAEARARAQLTNLAVEAILTGAELLILVHATLVVFATSDPSACALLCRRAHHIACLGTLCCLFSKSKEAQQRVEALHIDKLLLGHLNDGVKLNVVDVA